MPAEPGPNLEGVRGARVPRRTRVAANARPTASAVPSGPPRMISVMSTWTEFPSHVDPDKEMTPKHLAALFDSVGERALREAIADERVGSRPGRRAKSRVLTPRAFVDDARGLPPCSAPDGELPALARNGGCGRRGHGRAGKKRSPAIGAAVSATKRGKPQLALGPDEITLQVACRETGLSRKVLKEGALDGRLRHRV